MIYKIYTKVGWTKHLTSYQILIEKLRKPICILVWTDKSRLTFSCRYHILRGTNGMESIKNKNKGFRIHIICKTEEMSKFSMYLCALLEVGVGQESMMIHEEDWMLKKIRFIYCTTRRKNQEWKRQGDSLEYRVSYRMKVLDNNTSSQQRDTLRWNSAFPIIEAVICHRYYRADWYF